MKIENNIGWCDETGNKVTGCDKVSPGCKNCYAQVGTRARVLRAQGIETWGPKGQRYPVKDFAAKVRRLNRYCVCDRCHTAAEFGDMGTSCGVPDPHTGYCEGELRRIRIFADSNSDWLDDKWPIETLSDLLKDIQDCPNVDFQLLTKRPENFFDRLKAVSATGDREDGLSRTPVKNFTHCIADDWRHNRVIPHNVWIGVSVEDQKRADERIPLLLEIPAKVRFLSVEPLLEKVNIMKPLLESKFDYCKGVDIAGVRDRVNSLPWIHWVIGGGESGKDRRGPGVEPLIFLAKQCVEAGIPFFCKQDSAFKPGQQGRIPNDIFALKQFPTPAATVASRTR